MLILPKSTHSEQSSLGNSFNYWWLKQKYLLQASDIKSYGPWHVHKQHTTELTELAFPRSSDHGAQVGEVAISTDASSLPPASWDDSLMALVTSQGKYHLFGNCQNQSLLRLLIWESVWVNQTHTLKMHSIHGFQMQVGVGMVIPGWEQKSKCQSLPWNLDTVIAISSMSMPWSFGTFWTNNWL